MATIQSYPHIVKENGEPARLESHPRTRVALLVMDYLGRGLGAEDMVRHYPYLKLAEVHAAMAYYHDHAQEIDAESRRSWTNCNRKQTPCRARPSGTS